LWQLGASKFDLVAVRQIHSSTVVQVVRNGTRLEYRPAGYPLEIAGGVSGIYADALMTDEPGVLLSVSAADCLPVLIADLRGLAVAAVHSGWRGALKRTAEKTVGDMRRIFGSRPQDLIAVLGPSIRSCCYEVGQEVADAFCGEFVRGEEFFCKPRASAEPASAHPGFLSRMPPGHDRLPRPGLYLDLVRAVRDQLESAGVPDRCIHVMDFCTSCRNDMFFSYRREGAAAGRAIAVIGIRS
jgi:polyphenol oxidase